MKNISYYIMAAALTVATISVGGCTDDNESVSPLHSGVLSLYDFAPNTGMGGTQILINGEKYPINTEEIDVTINDVELSIVRSNEEQLLVEIPDNEAVDGTDCDKGWK